MEAPLLLPIAATASSSSNAAANHSPSSPSTQSIVARVLAVLAVASVSLFAQHEASKGFHIDVVNAAPRGTAAARLFDLFFVSNGEAARILHYANRRVERALFPDESFPRKRVTRVTLIMEGGRNLTADDSTVAAAAGVSAPGEYVISLNPGLMSAGAAADAVATAVHRAVARMWLWDGRGAAPAHVTEAIVDYLATGGASSPPASHPERCMSARFLEHLERRRRGFVARLNRAMRDRWSDAAVDAALGAPSRPLCAAYLAAGELPPAGRLVDSTSDAAVSRVATM